jgi:hypothetical protein
MLSVTNVCVCVCMKLEIRLINNSCTASIYVNDDAIASSCYLLRGFVTTARVYVCHAVGNVAVFY